MAEAEPQATEHLEAARDLVWEALQILEQAQRVMFKAGDRYVAQVWGDGVRAVLEVTERMADLSGDLSSVHIDVGKLCKKDIARDK